MTFKTDLKKWTKCTRSISSVAFFVLVFFSSCTDDPPEVTFSNLSANQVILQGTSVTITVNAVDDDGRLFRKAGITSVQFLIDGVLVSTDNTYPYSYVWNTYSVSLGNHTIATIATDTGENDVKKEVRVIINDAPTCNITSPVGVVYTETTIQFEAAASDQMGGMEKVEFYLDNSLLGTDFDPPYSYTWNVGTITVGSHTLKAKAIDVYGQATSDESVNQVMVNEPPVCNITNPGSIVYNETTTQFEATATDETGGVERVEFYLDNSLLGTDFDYPYSYTWVVGTITLGSHTLKAIAYDIYGKSTSVELVIEIKQVNIIGTWEGEYSGYDSNLGSDVQFKRHLVVNNDKTYENTLYGLPTGYSSDIVFEQESGTWEVNDENTEVSWTPTTCQRIDISNPGTLIDWSRGVHIESIILNSTYDQWSVRDIELSTNVDYYIKKL